jgi:hypothetical protein
MIELPRLWVDKDQIEIWKFDVQTYATKFLRNPLSDLESELRVQTDRLCSYVKVRFTWYRHGNGKVPVLFYLNWAPYHEGVLGEWRYRSTHSLTSALEWGEWPASRPGCFTPRKALRYPLGRRLGGPQSHSGRGGEEENSQPSPGIEP